jgi:hypothetical protein
MNQSELINHYVQENLKGRLELDQIRRELETRNLKEEEIRTIMRKIDREIQDRLMNPGGSDNPLRLIITGLMIALIGVVLVIGSFSGWFAAGANYLLIFGPLILGLAIMITGLTRKSRKVK